MEMISMPELVTVELSQYVTSIFIALGGAVGITLIILGLFKRAMQKWIDTAIEQSSQKVIVTLTNDLQRRTSAYQKMLEKEFAYYDTAAASLTNILTTAGSMALWSQSNPALQESYQRTNTAKSEAIYSALSSFKSDLYLCQCYCPDSLFQKGQTVLQACQPFLGPAPTSADLESLRSSCAEFMSEIKQRLTQLSH